MFLGQVSPRRTARAHAPKCCPRKGADRLASFFPTAWLVARCVSFEAWIGKQAPTELNPVRRFPFVSLASALIVLRVAVAIFFMAHAAVRVANGSIPQFGAFLGLRGWPQGVLLVWCITLFELIAGTLMALGWRTRWMALGLFLIAAMGIVIIHWRLGWFVGEHGTGGMEYSVSLMVSLLVIAAADARTKEKVGTFPGRDA